MVGRVGGIGDTRVQIQLGRDSRDCIMQALRACEGNRSAAARALGIGRRTLYAKMEKLDITPTWRVGQPAPGSPTPAGFAKP